MSFTDTFSIEDFFTSTLIALDGFSVEIVDDLGDDAVNLTLPWSVTNDFLEDNPDGFPKLAGSQAGLDLAYLLVNGDTDLDHPLLKAFDGTKKQGVEVKDCHLQLALDSVSASKDDEQTNVEIKLKVVFAF